MSRVAKAIRNKGIAMSSQPAKQTDSTAPKLSPIILTREAAAVYLSCTVSWLRLEVDAGHITPIILGRRVCFTVEELQRYVRQLQEEQRVAA